MKALKRCLPAIAASCLALSFSTDRAAQQNDPQAQTPEAPRIQVTVNSVLVPVVVHDSQGHAVGDLNKDDFQIFDNGKRQVLSGFTIEWRASLNRATNNSASAPASAEVSPAVPPPPQTAFISKPV